MGRKALSAPDGFKKCTACGEVKPATREFWHFAKRGYLGFTSKCIDCKNVQITAIRHRDPEKHRRWYYENKDRAAELNRRNVSRRKKEDPRHFYAVFAAWRERNRDKIRREHQEWEEANRDTVRLHKRASQARRRSARGRGSHTKQDILRQLNGQKNRCWWCQKKLDRYHVDHRIPLAKGGSNGPENIVIACPKCNHSKHARMPWQIDNPRLL
jgi:5-methylcytosine-specific restriction endonuclease McrA